MARPHRVDFDGAWQHVMNRGANKQITFLDDQDRAMFLAIVAEAVRRFGIEVHAYCLMPNHYHLLVRCPSAQLSRAMKHIGQVYTQRFNRRHGRDGALFRGRFHSILVDSDNYLINVTRYIHLNPMTKDVDDLAVLDDFVWSSLSAYEGATASPEWLSTQAVLDHFASREAYRKHVRSGLPDPLIESFYDEPFAQRRALGSRSFIRSVNRRSPDRRIDETRAGVRPPPGPPRRRVRRRDSG